MDQSWRKLPELRNDKLLFVDTSGYPLPGKIVPCLLCTKPFLMRMYTGHPDQICGECLSTYNDCAIVRCQNCHVVICRLVPKVLDSGFVIRPQAVLHSDCCNICNPGLAESHVVEITEWMRLVRPHKIILIPSTKMAKG